MGDGVKAICFWKILISANKILANKKLALIKNLSLIWQTYALLNFENFKRKRELSQWPKHAQPTIVSYNLKIIIIMLRSLESLVYFVVFINGEFSKLAWESHLTMLEVKLRQLPLFQTLNMITGQSPLVAGRSNPNPSWKKSLFLVLRNHTD